MNIDDDKPDIFTDVSKLIEHVHFAAGEYGYDIESYTLHSDGSIDVNLKPENPT